MIKKFTPLFFVLLAVLNVMISYGQETNPEGKKLSIELAKQDFTIFRDALEKVHPALYEFNEKETINRLFDSCYNVLYDDMRVTQFFMLCKFMISAIKDGHLDCNPPREIVQGQLTNAKLFPLRLWFAGDKAFVYCDNNNQFVNSTEIISINGQLISNVKNKLFSYLNSDGNIESKKYRSLNSGEATFNFFYYWLEGEKDTFLIDYKTGAGKVETKKVDAKILANDTCIFERKAESNYLSLDFTTDKVAILTIKSFAINRLGNDDKRFAHFLDSAFNIIAHRRTTNLIIDLRNNGGGEDSYGALLYSYLTKKPFAYHTSIEKKAFRFPVDAHPNLQIQQPNSHSFSGKCYFLINGKSFSTTSEFCAIAKSNKRGLFIGEETGGTYYGNTGGEQTLVTLPHSGIRFIIPHRKYVLVVKKAKHRNRGIIPNHVVLPTIEDIHNNNDVQLKYAIHLIGGK